MARGQHNQEKISLISLPSPDTFTCMERPGTSLTVTGYGLRTPYSRLLTYNLRSAIMPVAPISKCKEVYPSSDLTKSMLCSGDGRGISDSCQGDSGGPAVAYNYAAKKPELVGLTSWGHEECGRRGFYAVLTRVSVFVDWIQQSVYNDRRKPPEICERGIASP